MRGGLLGVIGLLLIAALPSSARCSEASEQTAIEDTVKHLIVTGKFAELNALEVAYLDPAQRASSGNRKLSIFYSSIRTFRLVIGGEPNTDGAERQFRSWLKFSPDAPAAQIALAYLYLNRGIERRGGGYAQSVPAANWPLIAADVDAAAAILTQHKGTISRDPAWYNLMEKIMLYRVVSPKQFDAVTREGSTRHPGYEAIWYNAAVFYLPQWNGSSADIDRIARLAAARTRASDGAGLYARVYLYLKEIWYRDGLFTKTIADRVLMIQSMRDVAARYPSDSNFVDFARVACLAGDQAETDRYTALIKDAAASAELAKNHPICPSTKSGDPSVRVAYTEEGKGRE